MINRQVGSVGTRLGRLKEALLPATNRSANICFFKDSNLP